MTDDSRDTDERTARPDIAFFSTVMENKPDPLAGLARDAESEGFAIESRAVRGSRVRASVEWLDLTAFALFLLAPVYSGLLNWLKDRVPELWRTFFDTDDPETIRAAIVTAHGPVPQVYSLTFSVWAAFRHGRVKLVFPEKCSEAMMRDSCGAFAGLMHAYALGDTYDGIVLDNEVDCYYGVIVVGFAEEERRLRVLNPFSKLRPDALENLRRLERDRRAGKRRTGRRVEPWIGNPTPPTRED